MIQAQYWDEAWNPLVGCTAVSPGCAHCWAASMASRFHPELAAKGKWLSGPQLHPERLDQPRRWRKPRTVFVANMSDLFHEAVPEKFILRVLYQVRTCSARDAGHRFLVLTKRPARMRYIMERLRFDPGSLGSVFAGRRRNGGLWLVEGPALGDVERDERPPFAPLLRNLWLGTSVENQRTADERLPELLATWAAHRWLSVEPLLEPVDLGERGLDGIAWCVVGAESGPRARPCRDEWVRSVVEQCRAAGVSVFVKQLAREDGGADMSRWPVDVRGRETL